MSVPASTNGSRDSSPQSLSRGSEPKSSVQPLKKTHAIFPHHNVASFSQKTLSLLNDLKSLVPSGSAQKQALQQQAFHQAALHQQALKQHALQSNVSYPTGSQQKQSFSSNLQGNSQDAAQQQASPRSSPTRQPLPLHNQATPTEVMDAEGTCQLDRASCSGQKDLTESSKRRGSEIESKASPSVGSVGEPRDSDPSEILHDKGEESLHIQSHSGFHAAKEGIFADLNAEPPVSEGEDAAPSESLQQNMQPECSRTSHEEKKRRKKHVTERSSRKKHEQNIKKATRAGKPRFKAKGEILDPRWDGDLDCQVMSVNTTKDDKAKNLKVGLIHVARKMPKNAHAHFTLGLMYQRLGQPSKAAPAFQKAVEILKTEEEICQTRSQFFALAQSHYIQSLLQGIVISRRDFSGGELSPDEVDTIVSKLKEAVQADCANVSIWNTIGLMLLQSGRKQNAISVFTSLLYAVPDYFDGLANLGVAYLHSENLEHAARCFQSLLVKDNSHPAALVNYAALLLRQYVSTSSGAGAGAGQGAYALRLEAAMAARQCLFAALKGDSNMGPTWVNLAATYAVSGESSKASVCLEQASKLEPTRMSIRYAVAMHRVETSEQSVDPSEQLNWAANEMASILREGDPTTIQTSIAWSGLAMVNRAQHETAASFEGEETDLKEVEERAHFTLQQAVQENPDEAVQWHQLGLHALCTLHFKEAQCYLKTAIARRQSSATAWSNLGIAIQLSQDPSQAEVVYKKALSLVQHEQVHSILSNLGNLYRQQKRFDDAHEAFHKALETCPDYAPACNNLGLLLIAEGKWLDAISTFKRALQADPFLDAAKSNQMKAEALAKSSHKSNTFHMDMVLDHNFLETSSADLPATTTTHFTVDFSASTPMDEELFPLPSIS